MTAFIAPTFRVVDLETTDFHPHGAPIEIGMCDLVPLGDFGAPIPAPGFISTLVNPDAPIPPQSSAVHHIVDEDVVFSPAFETVVSHFVRPDLGVLAFVAHQAEMERHYLEKFSGDTPWICTWKCALRLFPEAPGHSNQALRYWLNPQGLDRQMAQPAHRAGPDAYVTAFLLQAMLQKASPAVLIQWSNEPALLARIPFGDRKGQPWTEADDGFLDWILVRDFDANVLFTARHHAQLRRQAAA